jgi:hypothetical protein
MTDVTDRIRTMPVRRRWLAATATVANLAVIGSLAVQPAATATTSAPPQVKPLPAAGQETTLDMVATDVPIQVGGRTVTATFGGTLEVKAERNATDTTGRSMALRVVSFDMEADSAELGKVKLAKTSAEATPTGLVEMAKYYPMTVRSTLVLDFTLTADRLPSTPSPVSNGMQQAVPAGPLTLSTRKPAVLTSDALVQFPPTDASFRLEEPIELVLPGSPGTVSATIHEFPAKVTAK